mgnify:CR=1 FL=1
MSNHCMDFMGLSEQMGIDATIKVYERFHSYPEYSNADQESVSAIAEKLKGSF